MLDFIIKGGLVLWIIMGLALVAAAVVLERLIYYRRIAVDEEKLFQRIKTSLEKGHFDEALAICDTNLSPLSALMKVGIEHRDYPEYVQKEVLRDAAAQEVPALEKNITALGTISNIAPLLGLLGTVTGTMKAFGVLGQFGAVSDPSVLANGVSEALITTVGGIVVAVPATIFYNLLVSKATGIIVKLENQVNALILMINGKRTGEVAPSAPPPRYEARALPRAEPRAEPKVEPRVEPRATPRSDPPAPARPTAAAPRAEPRSEPPAAAPRESLLRKAAEPSVPRAAFQRPAEPQPEQKPDQGPAELPPKKTEWKGAAWLEEELKQEKKPSDWKSASSKFTEGGKS